jgi:hypothetical protein
MIKIKATYRELEAFQNYLDLCIKGSAKTQDGVKEYLLASSLKQLQNRIVKKMINAFCNEIELRKPDITKERLYLIKIMNDEVLSLCIYFNRHTIHSFLLPLQTFILQRIPVEVINAQKTFPTPSTWTVNELYDD